MKHEYVDNECIFVAITNITVPKKIKQNKTKTKKVPCAMFLLLRRLYMSMWIRVQIQQFHFFNKQFKAMEKKLVKIMFL